jgi:uncharacterized Zn-finger protein
VTQSIQLILYSRSSCKNKSSVQVRTCVVCHEEFATYTELKIHASMNDHATLKCRVQPCEYTHSGRDHDDNNHLKTSHPELFICQQCKTPFDSPRWMDSHAYTTGHNPFICNHQDCGKTFSRFDTYQRHQTAHQEDAKRFPCKYCKKYRGTNGFKRKDHLTQHLRGYHHIGEGEAKKEIYPYRYSCEKVDCPEYTINLYSCDPRRPFSCKSELMKHMKTVHNASVFPCPEPNCDRVEAKGYFRPADLRNHLKKVHGITNAVIKKPSFFC